MKNRLLLTSTLLLLFSSLGFARLMFKTSNQPAAQTFHATITRDCAPWDGGAFAVKVDLPNGNILDISIWQSPSITFPTAYTFPDSTGQVGNAILIYPAGEPESLKGTVSFTRVEEAYPLEGNFKFVTASGSQIAGIVKAEWDYQIVLCG
jgi:hypothetical protein